MGRVQQPGGCGHLSDQRDSGLVHTEVSGGAAQLAHADAAGAQLRRRQRGPRVGEHVDQPQRVQHGGGAEPVEFGGLARGDRDLWRVGFRRAERGRPQRDPYLARQLDGQRVDRDEQPAHEQPRGWRGFTRGTRPHHTYRWPGRQPVEHVPLGGSDAGDQLRDAIPVGQHGRDSRSGRRLADGRHAQRAQHRRQLHVGHLPQQVRGGPSETGRIAAQRLAHRAHQLQPVGLAPDQGERQQFVEAAGEPVVLGRGEQGARGREAHRSVRSGDEHQRLEDPQLERVERVDGALHRRANRQPAGQIGQVGRSGQREIGPAAQQVGELGVGAGAQPLGQGRRAMRGGREW